MGIAPESADAARSTAMEETTTPEPGTLTGARALHVPPDAGLVVTALVGVRGALSGVRARRVLGWVLVIGWVVWLAAVWVGQPRLVPQQVLDDDLARGGVTAYRVVTVDEDRSGGLLSLPYRVDVDPASDDADGVFDGVADGRPLTVAYWVDAPVASLRALDPNGASSDASATLVEQLRSAGVPEAEAADLWFRSPAPRLYNAGALLLLMSTIVAVLGPRPRRGTRWFWFWVIGGPLSVGVPIFAVAELLRPRYEPEGTVHPSGVAGRWNGLTGFALGFVGSFAGAAALLALNGLSPIWFIRG